jgi:hypothetical protein
MEIPISIDELTLWLGITAIMLSLTSEFLSLSYRDLNIIFEKRKLNELTDFIGLFFIVIFLVYILTELVN